MDTGADNSVLSEFRLIINGGFQAILNVPQTDFSGLDKGFQGAGTHSLSQSIRVVVEKRKLENELVPIRNRSSFSERTLSVSPG